MRASRSIVADIQHIQRDARENGFKQRPRWPMIILRSPKGWTGPAVVIDLVANKKADIIRVYLPPAANTLLTVTDHCLRSRHYVNVIVAGKQPSPQWLDMESAVKHCTAGLGVWKWASNDEGMLSPVSCLQ